MLNIQETTRILGGVVLALFLSIQTADAAMVRIKDIARVEFERNNPLMGYGLVVGLNGSGDSSTNYETAEAIKNYFSLLSPESRGLPIDLRRVDAKNSALVMVTAELPPYVRAGSRLDVTINSQFDATSLQGGTLLATPLFGIDGKVYGMAHGPVTVGGFSSSGGGGGGQQKNHPTVGTITDGAILERNANTIRDYDRIRLGNGKLNLILKNPDFTEAIHVQDTINESFRLTEAALALDPGTVAVDLKVLTSRYAYDTPMELIKEIEQLKLETDLPARVMVSERNGVIVAGADAKLSAVDIVHGDLRIVIRPAGPDLFVTDYGQAGITETGGEIQSGGVQRVEQGTPAEAEIREDDPTVVKLDEGDTVGNLIQAISGDLGGKSPRDIISILQALDRMGALHAELMFVGD